jgi:multidrug efflux pump subunit AcrA (membrane-fusion protein)
MPRPLPSSAHRSRTVLVPLVALALVAAACGREEAAPFGTAEVTVEPVTQVISAPADVIDRTYTATVRAAARVDLTSPGPATVARLDVNDGDVVVAGQTLGTLRSDALLVSLRQAEAAVASARVQRSASQSTLDRIEGRVPEELRVFDSRAAEVDILIANIRMHIVDAENDRSVPNDVRDANVTRLRLQEQALLAEREERLQAIGQVSAAQASVTQAEQALTQARRAVADLTLTAPVDGVVRLASDLAAGGGRAIGVGADVSPGQPVLTVTTTDGFRIELDVPEAALAPVVEGVRVTVDLEAFPGTPVSGTIVRVATASVTAGVGASSAVDGLAGVGGSTGARFVAEVELDDEGGLPLREGLTGVASLPVLPFAQRFEVQLEVDEVDVVLVTVGQQVVVEVDALRTTPLTGTIVALATAPERSATGATFYRARVRLDAPDADVPLRGGLTGTADVEVQRLDGEVTIPSTALLRSGGSEVVYVVRGGVAVEVPVQVLAFGEVRAAVRGELEAGERVVTTGVERVEAGTPVEVG